uniref:Secreted protein n=1 Tax=Ditylenchus dipsaci TaxID=166011 RepID=A0A915CRJ4_9BILA
MAAILLLHLHVGTVDNHFNEHHEESRHQEAEEPTQEPGIQVIGTNNEGVKRKQCRSSTNCTSQPSCHHPGREQPEARHQRFMQHDVDQLRIDDMKTMK